MVVAEAVCRPIGATHVAGNVFFAVVRIDAVVGGTDAANVVGVFVDATVFAAISTIVTCTGRYQTKPFAKSAVPRCPAHTICLDYQMTQDAQYVRQGCCDDSTVETSQKRY